MTQNQNPISVLMYHQVGKFDNPKKHRPVYCDVGRFRQQMAWLHFWNYNVLSLAEAYNCLFQGNPIPKKAVVLTFDDGCDNFREYAWPILKKYNFPATMFLVADLIGKSTIWMDDVPEKAPLMTISAIRELHKEGVHFGSHTLNHVRLAECSERVMHEEVYGSKAKLEDILGSTIDDFCYPYGSFNQRATEVVRDAGYRTGITCIRAAANYAKNPFEIPRQAISYGDTIPGWWWRIHMKQKPS